MPSGIMVQTSIRLEAIWSQNAHTFAELWVYFLRQNGTFPLRPMIDQDPSSSPVIKVCRKQMFVLNPCFYQQHP